MGDESSAAEATARNYATRVRGQRKFFKGKVVSTKMEKTICVEIERRVAHAKYNKYIRTHHKVYAHDETEQAKLGDLVRVGEGRPRSKLKRFYLAEILSSEGS